MDIEAYRAVIAFMAPELMMLARLWATFNKPIWSYLA